MDLVSGIRDPGSGKKLFRIPDPGVKKAPNPGSGSATLFAVFCGQKFNNLKFLNLFIFYQGQEINLSQLTDNYRI
jgi:hypothetical protein